MGPSFSDVDESLDSVPRHDNLPNFDYESSSTGSKHVHLGLSAGRTQDLQNSRDANMHRHQNLPSEKQQLTADILQARERKTSEISDYSYSDSEDRIPQESFNSDQIGSPENDFEVDNRRSHSIEPTVLTNSLPQRARLRRHRSLSSSSGFSDVDECTNYYVETSYKKPLTNKIKKGNTNESKPPAVQRCKPRRKRRQNQTFPIARDSVHTSDIDEIFHNTNPAQKDEEIGVEKSAGEVDLGGEIFPNETKFANADEPRSCSICCDVDGKVTRCEFCKRYTCDNCSNRHFELHALEVQERLKKLNELASSIEKELPRNRLKAKIDEAVEELYTASKNALQRACDVYQVSSSDCNAFIGSLVDQRISISASTKYLIKRIPVVLFSEDLCELQYFKKVYEGVREQLAKLSVEITDPRAQEMERLTLTRTFSPNGPFLGHNNLIISLSNFNCVQSQTDTLSKSSFVSRPWSTMHL